MTFQDDNGNLLEVDGEFAMTKQAVSFFNGEIKGDVSLNFAVDNNSVNRKTLNYDGPQMLNQVAFTKQPFNRIHNGNVLDRGYIVIQSDEGESLNCFYVSGNSNWIQLLQGLITDLDYTGVTNGTDYNIIYDNSASGIRSRISSTSGITFPYVDWIFNLNKGGGTTEEIAPLYIKDSSNDRFEYPLVELFPCFYLHSLVSEILSQNGLKISGSLINDAIYKSIIITPSNGLMKRDQFKNVYVNGSSQSIAAFTVSQYTSLTESTDPDGLFSNNSYTSNKKTGIKFNFDMQSITGGGLTSQLRLYKNGALLTSILWPDAGASNYIFITSEIGDVFTFYVSNAKGVPTSYQFNLLIEVPEEIGYGDYVNPSHFLPPLKNIDVIKFTLLYFGCSSYFDEYSKTITATIIESIKIENSYDWSEYYLSHRSEYTVEQAQNNYLKWTQNDIDTSIKKYDGNHTVKFADGNIETGNTLKSDKEIFKLPFKPSSFGIEKSGFAKANIPLINLVDDGDPIAYSAISQAGTSLTYTTAVSTLNVYEVVRITNSNDVDLGYFVIMSKTSPPDLITVRDTRFIGTGTGFIRKQKIIYNDVGANILYNLPNKNVSEYSLSSSIQYDINTLTSFPHAIFTKSKTGLGMDQWKNNLAIDNPDSGGFTDPTIKQLYFNKISKFLQNPNIRARMLLPESVYQGFKFDQFIYLKTEKLTGYFFVQSIVNYVDGNTPVEVNLYML